MRAWVVRAGENGSRDSWCLLNGYAGGGWTSVGDLTPLTTEETLQQYLQQRMPGEKPAAIINYRSQLWRFRHVIASGDLIVLPQKTTKEIAIGVVVGTYIYLGNEEDPGKRHVIRVDWKKTDLPRSAVGQDLLYSLGAFMTICEVKRNGAVKRLESLMLAGVDPGESATTTIGKYSNEVNSDDDALLTTIDIEQIAYDAVVSRINEKFLGHQMSRLVAEVLTAKGFHCETKPPGPDGGVDILAGNGPLGLDSPKIVVQVKSQSSQVGDEVVQTLQGAITRFGADQALLVAWGGINKNAKSFLETEKFRVRVWSSEDLVTQIFEHYSTFSEELRSELPLKQIWTVIQEQN